MMTLDVPRRHLANPIPVTPRSLGRPSPGSPQAVMPVASLRKITRREYEVLSLVAEGYSNKLIAATLVISERTVKNHLSNIASKLGALDRTHAVVTALRMGVLSL